MKFNCNQHTLIEAINSVQKAISSRTTLPILEGILLQASESTLKLTGYDLEMGIECNIQVDVITPGSIVIPTRFGEIIKKSMDETILIETKDNFTMTIKYGKSVFDIKGMNPESYPALPKVENEKTVILEQKEFKNLIRQTLFAASIEETRPNLKGCYVNIEKNSGQIVAIDGYRLALRSFNLPNSKVDLSCIIPFKTLKDLISILADEGKVIIYYSENQICFDLGKIQLVSRLIKGNYINYKNIIPKSNETIIEIDKEIFLHSVERASILISPEERRTVLNLKTDRDSLSVSTHTNTGQMFDEIEINKTGKEINIDFNPRYFIDVLKIIEEDKIQMTFNGDMGPCLIKPIEGESYCYLILPFQK